MRIILSRVFLGALLILFIFCGQTRAQQNLSFIRVSPPAKIVQGIGFAEIEINYSRPAVKGREVYGKLVPYGLAPNAFGNGKPMPWRAGANENTTFRISHDAKINGQPLAAGSYGLHMIAQENEWTIIFSNDTRAWGSFFYDPHHDALRIAVKPVPARHKEWLEYGFENLTTASCDVYLHWDELKVPFNVEFDEQKIVLDKYRQELSGLAGFNQAAWGAAARYCLQNNTNLDEAMSWIEKALSMNGGQNFNNTAVKAGLLAARGRQSEGDQLMEKAFASATEAELNAYGYQLMNQQRPDEAIKIFEQNVRNNPDSWNCYDSLAEALSNKGDQAGAKMNYRKALDMAPDDQKARIESILKNL